MAVTALEKGKGRALPEAEEDQLEDNHAHATTSSDSSDSDEDSSTSDSDASEEEDDEISQEFLDSLLNQARKNMSAKAHTTSDETAEEEVIRLGDPNDPTEACVPSPPLLFTTSLLAWLP